MTEGEGILVEGWRFEYEIFHQRVKNRRKKNTIVGLFNSAGVWCSEEEELVGVGLDYFRDMFTSSCIENF